MVEEHRPSTGGALVKLMGENHALGVTKHLDSATKMLVTKVTIIFFVDFSTVWWQGSLMLSAFIHIL